MSRFNDESAPRKKYNPKKKAMREIEFVNYHISEAQKAEIDKLKAMLDKNSLNPLDLLVMGGYKVSINVDWDNECYIVSATGSDRTVNEDKCCSSRSDDLDEALCIMLYKTFQNDKPVVWETTPRKHNWG